ncbi:N-acetylmuramoyl-L-alanine amidase [Butyrivibrio sp. AE3004]|uniref:N-acetylmuramoyl-L-alanine amidase n=1 Tax=Butyrivibrio sp. AE3004 TaxID=1506994 RepID=UPI0004947705|nr:N-acetylmuramoyl-L-alanine amidase [Butyrivibrio sp. AE3004]
MIEERLKKTAIMTVVFVLLSLSVMFFRAATKNVLIAEAGDAYKSGAENNRQYELKIMEPTDSKGKGNLVIPLESGVTSEDIQFVEKHGIHQFELYIRGETPDFYRNNNVISDLECIESGTFSPLNDKGMVCLGFKLDGLYETSTSLGDREIVVNFNQPDYENEKVVIIDPIDEVGLELLPYLKSAFSSEENIKIFFTTLDDKQAGVNETFALINEANADFYIQLGVDETTESDSGIRTYYNDRFFIRQFGNVQLADMLERYTVSSAGNNALGLAAAGEDNAKLSASVIPSALVTLGNINNRVDHDNLEKDSYLESCAVGIANGIRASFETLEPSGDESVPDIQQ